jgi:hypothetical protein
VHSRLRPPLMAGEDPGVSAVSAPEASIALAVTIDDLARQACPEGRRCVRIAGILAVGD